MAMTIPIHNHVANILLDIIETHSDIILLDTQYDRIWDFLRSMPVRLLLDLVSYIGIQLAHIPHMDKSQAETEITLLDTPYSHLFLVILDNIRQHYGLQSWYTQSTTTTLHALQRLREYEINDGITTFERQHLYEFASRIQDIYSNLNDDSDADSDDDDYHPHSPSLTHLPTPYTPPTHIQTQQT
jgi:hypothetical protein